MTPGEIRFRLDARLLAMARGGTVPVITGLHSLVVSDGVVSAAFDVVPGDGELLYLEFPVPPIDEDELRAFAWSLCEPEVMTVH